MATKVKGITIELNADASGIEKALKATNKSLSETQKQLTSVNKSLKLDPKNLELIEQKQRLLAKATDETANKLKALKDAQAKIAENNDGTAKMQAQYDALTREISDTEQKLKGLNQEQKEFNQQAQQAQTQSSAMGQALSKVGDTAQQVGEKMRGISLAAAGALTAIGGMVVNAGKQADEWLELSQQIGLSTDAIQKFEYASDRIDVDMSTLVGAITKMKGKLDESNAIWDRLDVKIKDSKGEYRDIESIFYDVVRAIGKIENETERDTVAMEMFGKKANELAGILDDGGAKLRALGKEAESMGLIVSEEDLQRLGYMNDMFDAMKAQIKAALVQAAIPAMEALMPLITKISNAIKVVAQILANLNPNVVRLVVIILALVAAITPVAFIISSICNAIQGLLFLLPMVIAGIQAISTTLASLLANPVVLTIAAIVAAIAALGFAIYEVVKHWDDIKQASQTALSGMKSAVNKCADALKKFMQAAKNVASNVKSAFEIIRGSFDIVQKALQQMIQRMIAQFNSFVARCRQFGIDVVTALVRGIESVVDRVINAFRQMAQRIKQVWDTLAMDAKRSGSQAASNYVDGYNSNPRRPMSNIFSVSPRNQMTPFSTPNGASNFDQGQLMGAINSLNNNLMKMTAQPTNVNVTLSGSAKNIFDTVTVQNSQLVKATGYHALA